MAPVQRVRCFLLGRVDAQKPSRIPGERGTFARESGNPHDSVASWQESSMPLSFRHTLIVFPWAQG